jgi:hypothetical protein
MGALETQSKKMIKYVMKVLLRSYACSHISFVCGHMPILIFCSLVLIVVFSYFLHVCSCAYSHILCTCAHIRILIFSARVLMRIFSYVFVCAHIGILIFSSRVLICVSWHFPRVCSYSYSHIFLTCAHTSILIFSARALILIFSYFPHVCSYSYPTLSSRVLILVSWYSLHVRSYSYSYIFLILVSWHCLHVCLPGAEGVALACNGLAEAIAVEAPAGSGRLRKRVFMCHTCALNANY